MPISEAWLCPFCCITDHHRLSGWKPPIHYLPDAAGQKAECDGTGFSAQASQSWYPGAGKAAGSRQFEVLFQAYLGYWQNPASYRVDCSLPTVNRAHSQPLEAVSATWSSSKRGHISLAFFHGSLERDSNTWPSFTSSADSGRPTQNNLLSDELKVSLRPNHWIDILSRSLFPATLQRHACQGWKFGGGAAS